MSSIKDDHGPLWWILINSAWFGLLVGTLLGVAGLYLAWEFYKRGKARPSIKTTGDSVALVEAERSDVEGRLTILFDGKEVDRVVSTTVGLWNDGNTIFRAMDIVQKDPPKLAILGGEVLQVTVQSVSREVIGAAVSVRDPAEIILSFDFLEPSDAITVQVIHTGSSNSVRFSGTLIGLPQGIQSYRSVSHFFIIEKWLGRIVIAIGLSAFLSFEVGMVLKKSWTAALITVAGIVAFIATMAAAIWLMEWLGKRWSYRVPRTVLENAQLRRRLELDKLFP